MIYDRDQIPSDVMLAIERYVVDKIHPGSCVEAILRNDLREAFMRADAETTAAMPAIVAFLYNHVPAQAWGSDENVECWLLSGEAFDRSMSINRSRS